MAQYSVIHPLYALLSWLAGPLLLCHFSCWCYFNPLILSHPGKLWVVLPQQSGPVSLMCGFEFPHEEVLLDSMTTSFRRFVQSGLFVCWWLYNECFLHYWEHEWHSKFLSIMVMMLDGIYVLYIDIHAFWWPQGLRFPTYQLIQVKAKMLYRLYMCW